MVTVRPLGNVSVPAAPTYVASVKRWASRRATPPDPNGRANWLPENLGALTYCEM